MKLTVSVELTCRTNQTIEQLKQRAAAAFREGNITGDTLDQLAIDLIERCRATGHMQESKLVAGAGADASIVVTVAP